MELLLKSLQELEKLGIYYIDLSNFIGVVYIQKDIQFEWIDRGEVLNFQNCFMFIICENSLFMVWSSVEIKSWLEKDRLGCWSWRKKWKDNCKCMRCEIMK